MIPKKDLIDSKGAHFKDFVLFSRNVGSEVASNVTSIYNQSFLSGIFHQFFANEPKSKFVIEFIESVLCSYSLFNYL